MKLVPMLELISMLMLLMVDDHVDVDLEQRTKLRKCLIKNKGSKLI